MGKNLLSEIGIKLIQEKSQRYQMLSRQETEEPNTEVKPWPKIISNKRVYETENWKIAYCERNSTKIEPQHSYKNGLTKNWTNWLIKTTESIKQIIGSTIY